jgi:hypothetical protein
MWVGIDNFGTKRMKGVNSDFVAIGADVFDETVAHVFDGIVGKRQTENAFGRGVGFCQNIGDPSGNCLSFAGTGTSEYQNRTVDSLHSLKLFGIKIF